MRGHNATCVIVRCTKDHRDRREKLEDVVNGKGVSAGERANARAALSKMGPAPTGAYQAPTGTQARPAGTARSGYQHQFVVDDSFFGFNDAHAFAEAFRAGSERLRQQREADERLRQQLARERARRAGFWVPDEEDRGRFEHAARETFADGGARPRSYNDILREFAAAAKMDEAELRRKLGLEDI